MKRESISGNSEIGRSCVSSNVNVCSRIHGDTGTNVIKAATEVSRPQQLLRRSHIRIQLGDKSIGGGWGRGVGTCHRIDYGGRRSLIQTGLIGIENGEVDGPTAAREEKVRRAGEVNIARGIDCNSSADSYGTTGRFSAEVCGVRNTGRADARCVHFAHEKLNRCPRSTLEGRLLCGRRHSSRESNRDAGLVVRRGRSRDEEIAPVVDRHTAGDVVAIAGKIGRINKS